MTPESGTRRDPRPRMGLPRLRSVNFGNDYLVNTPAVMREFASAWRPGR
jgi:hypothetical protein